MLGGASFGAEGIERIFTDCPTKKPETDDPIFTGRVLGMVPFESFRIDYHKFWWKRRGRGSEMNLERQRPCLAYQSRRNYLLSALEGRENIDTT